MAASGGSLPAFIGRRILLTIPLLLVISFAVYCMVLLLPGDPALTIAGPHATTAEVAGIRAQLHLNEPLLVQYWHWLIAVLHGNLGSSLFQPASQGGSVSTGIADHFPVTVQIATGGMIVGLLIGLPAGIAAGMRPRSWLDRVVTAGSSIGVAMPDFWLAMVLVILLAVKSHLLPAIGYVPFSASPVQWFQHMLMAWLALGIGSAAAIARQVRGSLIDTLQQDYMRTATAKGLARRTVIGKHALKNALSPVLTIVGIQYGYLLGGTFIIESIFSLPGLGAYMLKAISTKDVPVIQGVVLLTATAFIVINLVVDILYAYLNPKVRLG